MGEGGRVIALQVCYFCLSQGSARLQKEVHGQSGQPSPTSQSDVSLTEIKSRMCLIAFCIAT